MIKRTKTTDGVRVTFTLTSELPVSVVGDFNAWDPLADPLKPRANGTRSAAVVFAGDTRSTFRYLEDGGRFFDDPDADALEDNGCGATHGVLVIAAPVPAKPAMKAKARPKVS
jgi:hypothetical protein